MTIPRLPSPKRPGLTRADLAAEFDGGLRGRAVLLVNEQGTHVGWKVWRSALEFDRVGNPLIAVVTESDWWCWIHRNASPSRVDLWPAAAVWVEDRTA